MSNVAEHITRNGRVTSNEARNRQASFRQRMYDAGMVQVTGWVHSHQATDATIALAKLRANETLIMGCLRDTESNRFVSLQWEDNE